MRDRAGGQRVHRPAHPGVGYPPLTLAGNLPGGAASPRQHQRHLGPFAHVDPTGDRDSGGPLCVPVNGIGQWNNAADARGLVSSAPADWSLVRCTQNVAPAMDTVRRVRPNGVAVTKQPNHTRCGVPPSEL